MVIGLPEEEKRMEVTKRWYSFGVKLAQSYHEQPIDLSQRSLKRKISEEDSIDTPTCPTVPYKKRMVSRYYEAEFSEQLIDNKQHKNQQPEEWFEKAIKTEIKEELKDVIKVPYPLLYPADSRFSSYLSPSPPSITSSPISSFSDISSTSFLPLLPTSKIPVPVLNYEDEAEKTQNVRSAGITPETFQQIPTLFTENNLNKKQLTQNLASQQEQQIQYINHLRYWNLLVQQQQVHLQLKQQQLLQQQQQNQQQKENMNQQQQKQQNPHLQKQNFMHKQQLQHHQQQKHYQHQQQIQHQLAQQQHQNIPRNLSSSSSTQTTIEQQQQQPSKPSPNTTRPIVKKKHRHNNNSYLWEFLLQLLDNPDSSKHLIAWVDRDQGLFRLHDTKKVALLWGNCKNKPSMSYETMGRALRYYYTKGILKRVPGQRLVYQFNKQHFEKLNITRDTTMFVKA